MRRLAKLPLHFSPRLVILSAENRPSVPAAGVKSQVGESLGLVLFVVSSRAVDMDAVKSHLATHREYLRKLEDSDQLFAAGPLFTSDGESFEGDGMLIYRAENVAEASRLADDDPLHSSGARTYEIAPWMLSDGSLNVRVTLSRQFREVR